MPAITHVALTVSDLDRSVAWYKALLGSEPVLDEDTGPFHHTVFLIGGTLLGLHEFPDLKSTEPFDERRPGLDHVAFGWGRHFCVGASLARAEARIAIRTFLERFPEVRMAPGAEAAI